MATNLTHLQFLHLERLKRKFTYYITAQLHCLEDSSEEAIANVHEAKTNLGNEALEILRCNGINTEELTTIIDDARNPLLHEPSSAMESLRQQLTELANNPRLRGTLRCLKAGNSEICSHLLKY